MAMATKPNPILTEIEDFLVRKKMGPTTFGQYATENPHLVSRLRAGGDVHTRTAERIRAFMEQHR